MSHRSLLGKVSGRSGLTLPELMITTGLFALFLVISSRVVDSYYKAYQKMDLALPSNRSLFHLFEALTREFSGVEGIESPSLDHLHTGVYPSWRHENTTLTLTVRGLDGRRRLRSLAYSKSRSGLVCLDAQLPSDATLPKEKVLVESPEPLFLGESGPLWIQLRVEHGQALLLLRLYPWEQGGRPVQTVLPLSTVCSQQLRGLESP